MITLGDNFDIGLIAFTPQSFTGPGTSCEKRIMLLLPEFAVTGSMPFDPLMAMIGAEK